MNNIVINEIFLKKAGHFFTEHKNANNVLLHGKFGKKQSYWNVQKNGDSSFIVTEVNTSKNRFLIKEAKPFEYDPEQRPMAGTGLTIPKSAQKTIGKGPTQKTAASSDPWDPNNPKGEYAKLVQKVGLQKAMLSMPDDKLKRFFGISKQSLQGKMTPTGKLRYATQQLRDLSAGEREKRGEIDPGAAKALQQFGRQKTGVFPKKESKQPLHEASPAFARMSSDFMDAVGSLDDHAKLSKAHSTINMNMKALKDPQELEQAGKMLGMLTGLVDKTTAQTIKLPSQKSTMTKPATSVSKPLARITPAKKLVSANKIYRYKFILK